MPPIILTEHDTYETASLAGAREGVIAPDTPRKITKALARCSRRTSTATTCSTASRSPARRSSRR